jgi:3-oxosteroid 1-dehydrogenase
MTSLTVIGAGLGGFSAAIAGADAGLDVRLIERGEHFGGAAAFSGGQVWVGGNHVADREGSLDSVDETLSYIAALTVADPTSYEPQRAREWVVSARRAAQWFEDHGVIEWTIIPGYPDYYWPDVEGSKPAGRYLTTTPYDASNLGDWRDLLIEGPHFPVGISYDEAFALGGMATRSDEFRQLLAQRRSDDILTFGRGVLAAFAAGARRAGVSLLTATEATQLVTTDNTVTGVRVSGPEGVDVLDGPVILATGSHDWATAPHPPVTPLDPVDSGSLAPRTLHGDIFEFAEQVGAATGTIPNWAAPVLPGYEIAAPEFSDDPGFRTCVEHCLPHAIIVNRAGERFCDDSWHPDIVEAALREQGATRPHVPMFMIWDSFHHRRYGLGATAPGQPYPASLVTSANTLEALGTALGVDAAGLAGAVESFNGPARTGSDPSFGRGTKLSVRMFRGDLTHEPNPVLGPVEEPPFFGMRLKIVNTGIASAGIMTTDHGRVARADGTAIPGLYAVGECALRTTAGVAYNSGFSLSRAMTYGWLAARHAAGVVDD